MLYFLLAMIAFSGFSVICFNKRARADAEARYTGNNLLVSNIHVWFLSGAMLFADAVLLLLAGLELIQGSNIFGDYHRKLFALILLFAAGILLLLASYMEKGKK